MPDNHLQPPVAENSCDRCGSFDVLEIAGNFCAPIAWPWRAAVVRDMAGIPENKFHLHNRVVLLSSA
jgi:hypothetical protein